MRNGVPDNLEERMEGIKRMRDELRAHQDLLGMDAPQALEEVEKHIEEAERKLRDGSATRLAVARALHEIRESLAAIRARADRGASSSG